jgi:hypothetical protein
MDWLMPVCPNLRRVHLAEALVLAAEFLPDLLPMVHFSSPLEILAPQALAFGFRQVWAALALVWAAAVWESSWL